MTREFLARLAQLYWYWPDLTYSEMQHLTDVIHKRTGVLVFRGRVWSIREEHKRA